MSQDDKSYRVFTIDGRGDRILEYATVQEYILSNKTPISVIVVGDTGRGRKQDFLPINAPKGTQVKCVSLGTTKAGKPRFWLADHASQDEEIIVIAKIVGGYRGGASFSGDMSDTTTCNFSDGQSLNCCITKLSCENTDAAKIQHLLDHHWTENLHGIVKNSISEFQLVHKDAESFRNGEKDILTYVKENPALLLKISSFGDWFTSNHAGFPCKILARGEVAQGVAGHMGSNAQYIFIAKKGLVFSFSYSGRLYGSPSRHYLMWDGSKLHALTGPERAVADLF